MVHQVAEVVLVVVAEEVVLQVVAVDADVVNQKVLQLKLSVSDTRLDQCKSMTFCSCGCDVFFLRGWSILAQCRERNGLPLDQRHDPLLQCWYLP